MKLNIKEIQAYVIDIMKTTVEICDRNGITYYCQAGTVLGAVRHSGQIPWDHDADLIVPENELDRFIECMVRELPQKYYVGFFSLGPKDLRAFPRIGVRGFSTEAMHVDIFRLIGLPDDRQEQEALLNEIKEYRSKNLAMQLPFRLLLRTYGLRMALKKLLLGLTPRDRYVKKIDEACRRYPYETAKYVANPFGRYGVKNIFEKGVYGEGQMHPFEDFQVRIPSEVDFYLKQYYRDYMQLPPEAERNKELEKVFDVR
jgi:lipopolysaccharide cholinephosphotransferase